MPTDGLGTKPTNARLEVAVGVGRRPKPASSIGPASKIVMVADSPPVAARTLLKSFVLARGNC